MASTIRSKQACDSSLFRFMETCLSCDDLYIRSVVTQRPSYDCSPHERLSPSIESQLTLLLQREIEYHQEMRILKADLKRRYDWTLNRAFASIDVARDGFVTFSSLLNFCRLNGYNPTENEVIAMVRRLDVDADQRINFDEFRLTFDDDGQPLSYVPTTLSRDHGDSFANSPLKQSPMRIKHASPRRVEFEETKAEQVSQRLSGTGRMSPLRSLSPRRISPGRLQHLKQQII